MPTLEDLAAQIAELRDRLNPPAPTPAPGPSRVDLERLVVAQQESVRIAEEGQVWVDAVAVAEDDVNEARAALELAVQALGSDLNEDTLAAVEAARMQLVIRTEVAQQAYTAAAANRSVTVDRAHARLAAYELLLDGLGDDDELPADALATLEESLGA